MHELRGMVVPCATPVDANEVPDVQRAKEIIDHLIESDVHSLLIPGDTGEFFTLTAEERLGFSDETFAHINGRVPVVIRWSALSTCEAVSNAKQAESLGADALMMLPPYYRSATEPATSLTAESCGSTLTGDRRWGHVVLSSPYGRVHPSTGPVAG